MRKKFSGLYDSQPIDSLIDQTTNLSRLRNNSVKLWVGTVSLPEGKIVYLNQDHPDFKEYVKASKAMPIFMPSIPIGDNLYNDGGLIDSAPLNKAIEEGADEIVVIGTLPKIMDIDAGNMRELKQLAERVMEIVVWNTLNNDIQGVIRANQRVHETAVNHPNKRLTKLTVIRPEHAINITMTSFSPKDIYEMIQQGRKDAEKCFHKDIFT